MTHPLRDLADKIRELAADHPAYSQAREIVDNCCNHLTVVAGFQEQIIEAAQRSDYCVECQGPCLRRPRHGEVGL